jgi:hypothetical protein
MSPFIFTVTAFRVDVALSDRRDSIEVKKINVAGNVSASEVPS